MNPPRTEILALTEATGKIEEFTYIRNYNWLKEKGVKSFVYNKNLSERVSPFTYWILVTSIIYIITLFFSARLLIKKKNDKGV